MLSKGKQSLLKPSRLKKDGEGVASVVGTILALVVFLSLLGVFTNHYVPSMMAGNEHQHDNAVLTQFSDFKQSVDSMMMYSTASPSNTLTTYDPVTLGSAGVPMFAVGTQGELNIIQQSGSVIPFFTVSFSYKLTSIGETSIYHLTSASGGGVVMNIPNRYYVPQSVLYENDAVILGQNSGQLMIADPGFSVGTQGGLHLSILQVSIVTATSSNMSLSGTNTIALSSHLLSLSRDSYSPVSTSPSGADVFIAVGTPFPEAWLSFFNSTLAQAGLVYGVNYSASIQNAGPQMYVLNVGVTGVSTITLTNAVISVSPEE